MVEMKVLQVTIDIALCIFKFFKKFNIFKFLEINSKYKNLNRLFISDPKNMYLSFSEQNIYKNPSEYFKNFKYIRKKSIVFKSYKSNST